MSLKKASLVAGLGLLIMTLSWLLSDYLVFRELIESDNIARTVSNIKTNEILFRAGILGLLIVLLCDILVAWALFIFLKPVNHYLSLLTAWLRLVYSVILGIAILNYTDILQLISKADYIAGYGGENLITDIMLSIDSFQNDWNFGLIFFGFHLALLGYLALKSDYIPKIISLLLVLAGISYLIDYLGVIIFADYSVKFSLYLGWGELIFMFWLLIKGPKIEVPD